MKKNDDYEIVFELSNEPLSPEQEARWEEAWQIITDMIIQDWIEENNQANQKA